MASQRTEDGRYFTLIRGIDVGGLLLHRQVVYFVTGVYNSRDRGQTKATVEAVDARSTIGAGLAALLKEVHNRRLSVGWIRRRISVNLPYVPRRLPAVGLHPLGDRVVGLVHPVVWPAMDRHSGFAPWRLSRVDLTR